MRCGIKLSVALTPALAGTSRSASRIARARAVGPPRCRFKCGGGTHLDVTKSTVGTADEQTQASWQVDDIRAEVAELRARGVKVEDHDLPGLKTEDGIADIGFAWAAWIIDLGNNALGILQLKQ